MAASDIQKGGTHSGLSVQIKGLASAQVLRSLPATTERDFGMGTRVDIVDTAATVKKKFQCTPYSLACSWYSNVFTLYRRTSPADTCRIVAFCFALHNQAHCGTLVALVACTLHSRGSVN